MRPLALLALLPFAACTTATTVADDTCPGASCDSGATDDSGTQPTGDSGDAGDSGGADTGDSGTGHDSGDTGDSGVPVAQGCVGTVGTALGDCAPDATFPEADGGAVTLSDALGKVVVIDMSAMWCHICQDLAPYGNEVVGTYDSGDLLYLTLLYENTGGGSPTVGNLATWKSAYALLHPVVGDTDRAYRDLWGGRERPLVVVIGKDGTVRWRGGPDTTAIDATLVDAVAE